MRSFMRNKRPRKMYEQVAEEMIRMIESGRLYPGEKLPPLAELAKLFGVSRATVREAFSVLQGMGLIALRHGEGTFVQQVDMETMILKPMNAALLLGWNELISLHEVRELLETGACRMAAARATEEDRQAIEQAFQAFASADEQGENRIQADLSFHLAITHASKNLVIINLMQVLAEPLKSLARMDLARIPFHRAVADYRAIAEAIGERDGERAYQAMSVYLQRVREGIEQGKKRQTET
jgi:GntR family transcriptional regulator, transcriptional repressor for pyruvate dehydrogenase complex